MKQRGAEIAPGGLLLPEEYLHRHACKVEILAQLIFNKAVVRLFEILRQVAEKGKHG